MRTCDNHAILSLGFVQCISQHLMGHRAGEQHQQIGASDFVFQAVLHLREDFCLTVVLFAKIFKDVLGVTPNEYRNTSE